VERDKSGNTCSLCDATGLTRSEMSPLCSNFGIHVEERRLDKELISPARQRDDPIDVLFVVGSVAIFCPRAVRSTCCLSTPRGMDWS
jgi:hypothetical protein